MPGLSFDIFAKDKGAAAAFQKVAKNADSTKEAMDRVTKANADAASASDKLRKTQAQEADALGKVRVAAAKLDEIRKDSKSKTSQIAAAEEALAAAQRKAAQASDANAAAVKKAATAQDAAKAAAKQLADAQSSAFDKVAKKADDSAKKIGDAGEQSGSRFVAGFTQRLPVLGGKISGFFKTSITAAAGLAAGALAGAGFVSAFNSALEQGASKAKLQGRLGLTDDEAKKAGKIAGDLFTANYGDSLEGVNDAIASVIQNTNVTLNSVDLKPVTAKVLDLATTFDQDLGGVTRAVGQLMRTGLVKNANEALDVLTVGFQSGADKADDLVDTLNEYPTQFRKLGLDAKTATGILSQGLKAGARDSDKVADALKEFSIRAVDGSKTTADGFKRLGLSYKTMSEAIGKGGKPAAAALDLVFDRLRNIKDPVKQSQVAVELFGAQAEDLGAALLAIDPSTAVQGLGQVAGAAGKLDQTLGRTPQAVVSSFFRTLKQKSTDTMGGVILAFSEGKTEASGFQGAVETAAVGVRKGFDKLSGLGAKLFDDAKAWGSQIIAGVKNGVDTGDWKPLGKSLGSGISKGFDSIGDGAGDILDSIGRLLDKVDWKSLGTSLSDSILGLVHSVDWKRVGSSVGDALIDAMKKAKDLSTRIGTAIQTFINAVDWQKVGHDSTDAIGQFIGGIDWAQLGKSLAIGIINGLKIGHNVYQTVISSITDVLEGAYFALGEWGKKKAMEWGPKLWDGLKSGVAAGAKGIGQFLKSTFVDPIVSSVKSLFGIRSPSRVFAGIGNDLVAGFKSGVASAVRGIGTWIYRTMIVPAVTPFTSAGRWLQQHGRNLVAGFKLGAQAIAGGIGRWMYDHVAVPSVRIFSSAGSWLSRAGRDLIGGLIGGVAVRMKGIGSWLKTNVVDKIVGAVKSYFGIHSPSTVFAGIGGHLVEGLLQGMGANVGTAIAKKVFGDMPSALRAIVGKGLVSVQELPRKALDALGSAVGIGSPIGGPAGNTNNEGIVRTLAAQYGWGSGAQWSALRSLIMGESGFRNTAQNPTSSAYGLFQFLDSTWGSVGASKTSDPWAQTVAGLKYIARSYGTPANAYAKWSSRSPHWYDNGGVIAETVLGVGLRSGRPYGFGGHGAEQVTPVGRMPKPAAQPQRIEWVVNSSGAPIDDLLAQIIRKYVRVHGGNVQVVLGP